MPDYGIVPTGFARKPLAAILADIEAANVARFGNDIVQDESSALGQLNGLVADVVGLVWEQFQDLYASFDPLSASGPRLDLFGGFQRLRRLTDETDVQFRDRITNTGIADIKLISRVRELEQIAGVTYAWIIENDTTGTNEFGMPPASVAYCVQGGDDVEVASAIYTMALGGIGLFGNYIVEVNVDGLCRSVHFIRPENVPIRVEVEVIHIPDACECAPPSTTTIEDHIIASMSGLCGYKNGDSVERRRIASETVSLGNLEIIDVAIARVDDTIELVAIPLTIYERAVFTRPYVSVTYGEI